MVRITPSNLTVQSDSSRSIEPSRGRQPESSGLRRSFAGEQNIDEVIGSLANAYENKRAQQVTEWLGRNNAADGSTGIFV